MNNVDKLTLKVLRNAVEGDAVGMRSATRLQPAGGPGTKVFPPTYEGPTYAIEERQLDGRSLNREPAKVKTVLLDSVASQANRLEDVLLSAWEEKRIDIPVISVDFSDEEGLKDLGRVSSLEAPHRIADAVFRDSVDAGGMRFPNTAIGSAFATASVKNATPVYLYCPTALVFGVWNSTRLEPGPQHKFQRLLVSEVVAKNAHVGVSTRSRLDPLGIGANVPIFRSSSDDRHEWTLDESEAERDKRTGKPILFGDEKKSDKKKGVASAINHSNVTPSVVPGIGGITFDFALQTTVLSFPALRRLRFPFDAEGNPVPDDRRRDVENAARTALAALALFAVVELRGRGFDLRSRSFLIPEDGAPFTLEMLPSSGGNPKPFALTSDEAADLLREAGAAAARERLPWNREPIVLRPAPKLAALIRESRKRDSSPDQEKAGG